MGVETEKKVLHKRINCQNLQYIKKTLQLYQVLYLLHHKTGVYQKRQKLGKPAIIYFSLFLFDD